jgi:hypothetical protein
VINDSHRKPSDGTEDASSSDAEAG